MVDLKKNVDKLCSIAKQLDNQKLYQVSLFLRQRINQPDSYVVFVGESCSGKSTIINSLIRKDILPVSSVPSTGTITEVFVDENTDHDSYAVINRNATMELLDYPTFCELACRPDPNVQRLRAVLPSSGLGIPGVRLFDTPGYGSLIEAHDEVLMDFLPNCDSVVYIVGYKVGIQKEDHEFLGRLEELTRLGIPIYLVINRCPAGVTDSDRRVAEIYRTATSLLTNQEIPLFLIPSAPTHQELFIAPALSDLKAKIVQDLNSQDRRQDLYAAFLAYLNELAALLRSELERRIRNLEMDAAEAASLRDKMEKLGAEFQHAIDSIVRPGFHKIKTNLPKCVANRRDTMEKKICDEISRQHVGSKDEMIVYSPVILGQSGWVSQQLIAVIDYIPGAVHVGIPKPVAVIPCPDCLFVGGQAVIFQKFLHIPVREAEELVVPDIGNRVNFQIVQPCKDALLGDTQASCQNGEEKAIVGFQHISQ